MIAEDAEGGNDTAKRKVSWEVEDGGAYAGAGSGGAGAASPGNRRVSVLARVLPGVLA
jgi:hypothetical protein